MAIAQQTFFNPASKAVMVDIETLAKSKTSVIISIASAFFDPMTGQITSRFKRNINIQSCLNAGLEIDGDTISWWLKQDAEIRASVLENPKPIFSVLKEFESWFFENKIPKHDPEMWCNGTSFDFPIISSAFLLALKKDFPWKYYMERDVRTILSLFPDIKAKESKIKKHDPMIDVENQIKSLVECLERIRKHIPQSV
jgi:3' exoribonuclease, RNase T-like